MSWLTRAIMNVLGIVIAGTGILLTGVVVVLTMYGLYLGVTEGLFGALVLLVIGLIVTGIGYWMMPYFRATWRKKQVEGKERGERWANNLIDSGKLDGTKARIDAASTKLDAFNEKTFRNQLAAIEREATLPWYKRSFFKDTRKKYILKELAKLEAQKMAAAHEEIRTASLDEQMKAVHIDSVSDDEWNAHMKKTAELAAEGQKVI